MTERIGMADGVAQSGDARKRADTFFHLHAGAGPLILVNAWDAGSARVIEQAGAPAIATTSAGMAWSLGYPDGEQVPTGEFIAACARIIRVVSVPVSIDIERGFGRSSEEVCAVVRALIELGIAGVNIEDGVLPETHQVTAPAIACERIEAVRAMAMQANARLFINARIDTYLVANDDREARYEDTVKRARLYEAAGADGIFVPGLDLAEVAGFVSAVSLPVNVYAGGGWSPPIHGLRRAGVRRVSLGCGPSQATFGLLRRIATEAFNEGSYHTMSREMLPVGELNGLFSRAP